MKRGITILLLLAAAGAGLYFAVYQPLAAAEREQRQERLRSRTAEVLKSIEALMLGDAPSETRRFFQNLTEGPSLPIRLYRPDGSTAFADSATTLEINNRLKSRRFSTDGLPSLPENPPPLGDAFGKATGNPPVISFFQSETEGERRVGIYRPVINYPECAECHGDEKVLLGVLAAETPLRLMGSRRAPLLWRGAAIAGLLLILLVTAALLPGRAKKRREDAETASAPSSFLPEREEVLLFTNLRNTETLLQGLPADRSMAILSDFLKREQIEAEAQGGEAVLALGDRVLFRFAPSEENPALAAAAACRCALNMRNNPALSPDGSRNSHLTAGIYYGRVLEAPPLTGISANRNLLGSGPEEVQKMVQAGRPGDILISESVYRLCKEEFETEGPLKLVEKGDTDFSLVYRLRNGNRKDANNDR